MKNAVFHDFQRGFSAISWKSGFLADFWDFRVFSGVKHVYTRKHGFLGIYPKSAIFGYFGLPASGYFSGPEGQF